MSAPDVPPVPYEDTTPPPYLDRAQLWRKVVVADRIMRDALAAQRHAEAEWGRVAAKADRLAAERAIMLEVIQTLAGKRCAGDRMPAQDCNYYPPVFPSCAACMCRHALTKLPGTP